jgi:pimeloyl-ACP methyl ester carboxylesterase
VIGQDSQGTRYERLGRGDDVVLVHGLGLRREMWQWQAPALAERYRVLSYDLLGHGDSLCPNAPYSMDGYVGQLKGLVDFLDVRKFVLIGFSLGGMIAQAFTLAHPSRVCGLAVLHSAYDRSETEREAIRTRVRLAEAGGSAATVHQALERWFTEDFAKRRPDVLAKVREWVLANDPKAFAAAYHVLAEADAELAPHVADIRCPALVITGSEDFGNSPDMAARMARTMQNAACRILPGLRHMGLAERPDAVLSELLPFLAVTVGK